MKKKRRKKKKIRKIKLPLWAVISISAATLLLLSIPFIGNSAKDKGASVPVAFKGEYGIDISHHNGNKIVWDSLRVMTDRNGRTVKDVAAAKTIKPISYIFIKATEGEEMADKNFKRNWKSAAEHNIQRGAYHFFRSSKDPVKQANNFIRTVGELRYKDLPPVLDIETIHRGCSKAKLNENVLIWLRLIERHYGKRPIVYTYDSFAQDYLSKEILDNYTIWIAHYKTERPDIDNWQYWQFTDEALVYGIHGKVDLNVKR